MMAIAETEFKGYVAQEFIPTYSDKIAALRMAVNICDI
jgi:hydroxypyruvate isomerase